MSKRYTIVLKRGGFSFKGVTFSGKDLPTALSNDQASINVAGMGGALPKQRPLTTDHQPLTH